MLELKPNINYLPKPPEKMLLANMNVQKNILAILPILLLSRMVVLVLLQDQIII